MTTDIEVSLTDRETECLNAAVKLLDKAIRDVSISGWGGISLDPRISARQLLVDVAHDKYVECVAAGTINGLTAKDGLKR